nr:hypothetical protein [Tanacetum cinerariifolium]
MQDMSKDSDLCDLHATPSLRNKNYFVTFIDDASRFCYVYLLHTKDEALDKFKVFKTEVELQQGSLIKRFKTDTGGKAVVRLLDLKLKTLGERGIECIFVGYAKHSKAFRFYVIEPNDSVAINSIIESMDAIFDEHRFSSVPRPSQKSLKDRTEDSGVLVIPKKVIDELIEGTRDEVSDQYSYCFNFEDDPKTFNEAMKSHDVAFWKEAINDEMDSIMGNNTWVLTDLPPGMDYFDSYAPMARISTIRLLIAMASIHNLIIHQMNVKIAFLNRELEVEVYINQLLGFIMPGNENKVDLTKEFLSSRFSMKDIREADVILGIRIKHESNGIAISQSHYIEKVLKKFNYSDCTPVSTLMDTCEKSMPNKGPAVSQLEYSRVIGCLMYAMTCTRYTSNPGTQHWQAIQRVLNNNEDNSSTSGWVFLLSSAAGKEVEWLKNLHLEIPLFVIHRVSKLKVTIREYSIKRSILSGIAHQRLNNGGLKDVHRTSLSCRLIKPVVWSLGVEEPPHIDETTQLRH